MTGITHERGLNNMNDLVIHAERFRILEAA
jgi:hypothetical protein